MKSNFSMTLNVAVLLPEVQYFDQKYKNHLYYALEKSLKALE
jgi:hypothetical protein